MEFGQVGSQVLLATLVPVEADEVLWWVSVAGLQQQMDLGTLGPLPSSNTSSYFPLHGSMGGEGGEL